MKFYDWVILFKDVDRPIGDLAKDILKADNFPKDGDFESVSHWVLNAGLPRGAYRAFEEAWDYYKVDSL
ncbi:MAG: hypothetical protein HUJ83_10610 [Veillonella sp.]|nr:hypothetical protein [Veillonella sp.]